MLLLIFSSCVTNFAEEKYIIANFEFLNSCKKNAASFGPLEEYTDGFVQQCDSSEKVADIVCVRGSGWEGILFSETEEILKVAAAACLSNNCFSVCHWEFRKSCSKLREKPKVPENEDDSK